MPLIHEGVNVYVMNVVNVLDCVDWSNSDIQRFKDGSFAGFNKLVFDFNKIPPNTYMFKYKERVTTEVYITELFKDLIEKNNLKGLDFSIVYDSEFTLEKEFAQGRSFQARLAEIETLKGKEIAYENARELVDQHLAFASGKWKIQLNKEGQFMLGELLENLNYQWISPVYVPPVFFTLKWHEVERSAI